MINKPQFLKMLNDLKQVNVVQTPCVRFKTLLLGRLLRDNVPAAPVLVGNMKVELTDEFVNDGELVDAAVDAYATVLNNTWRAVLNMPLNQADQLVFFIEMTKGLSLTYSE